MVGGDDRIQDIGMLLKGIDLKAYIPSDSQVMILRRGVLSCHEACEFVLMSPEAAENDRVASR